MGALFFVLLQVFVNSAKAEDHQLMAAVGISAVRFHYQEFSEVGRILDTEQGGILGGVLVLRGQMNNWTLEGSGSFHTGTVPYVGQTNLGTPYNTRTYETLMDMALRVGYWIDTRYPVMPFVGMGYRRWDRDILPGTLGGLFESYRWPYYWTGIKVALGESTPVRHQFDLGLIKPIHPEMTINFKGAFNASPRVFPASKVGWRLSFTSTLELSNTSQLTLMPFYEYWALERSPLVSQNGVDVYEPASKTNNVGVNVRIGQDF